MLPRGRPYQPVITSMQSSSCKARAWRPDRLFWFIMAKATQRPAARLQVSGQAAHARVAPGLGKNVAEARRAVAHTILQRAVHPAHGQCLVQFLEDFRARVGIAQQFHQQTGRQVVVVGQPAAIGQPVVGRRQAQPLYQPAGLLQPVLGRHAPVPGDLRPGAPQHSLCIQVVALLQHLAEHGLFARLVGGHQHGLRRVPPQLGKGIGRVAAQPPLAQPLHEGLHEQPFGGKDVDDACLRGRHVAAHEDVIAVVHPVAGDPEGTGRARVGTGAVDDAAVARLGRAHHRCRFARTLARQSQHTHRPLLEHKRREVGLEGRWIVVPQPAAAPIERVLGRDVAVDAPRQHREGQAAHAVGQHLKVVLGELGVEAAHHVEVAVQGVALYTARVPHLGAERLARPAPRQGRDGRHQLHGRSRAREHVGLVVVNRPPCGKVDKECPYVRPPGQHAVHKPVHTVA